MLHLLFSDNGIDRIKDILRPTDQVVQLSSERILLVDTVKYLDSLNNNSGNKESSGVVTGEIIDPSRLASIINNAQSIKGTY